MVDELQWKPRVPCAGFLTCNAMCWQLNAGEKSLSTIAGEDVTKLSLKSEDNEGFDMVFPFNYSIGNTLSTTSDALASDALRSDVDIVPKKQKEAKIKVHQGSGDSKIAAANMEKEVYIDYLFDASDFLDCGGTPQVWDCVSDRMYFVYDPTISSGGGGGSGPTSSGRCYD